MAYLAALYAPPDNRWISIHCGEPEAVTARDSHSQNRARPPAGQSTVFLARHKQHAMPVDSEEPIADMPRQPHGKIKCKKL